jgi:hypothetical protein
MGSQLTQTVTHTLTVNLRLIVRSSVIGLMSQFALLLKRIKKFAMNMRSAPYPIFAGTLLLKKRLLKQNVAWNNTVWRIMVFLDGKMLTGPQQLPIFRIIHTMESIVSVGLRLTLGLMRPPAQAQQEFGKLTRY